MHLEGASAFVLPTQLFHQQYLLHVRPLNSSRGACTSANTRVPRAARGFRRETPSCEILNNDGVHARSETTTSPSLGPRGSSTMLWDRVCRLVHDPVRRPDLVNRSPRSRDWTTASKADTSSHCILGTQDLDQIINFPEIPRGSSSAQWRGVDCCKSSRTDVHSAA